MEIHKITPIFKSSEKTSVCNYRPISLLSSVSKVLERLIYNEVIGFLYLFFSCSQFGFLAGRSTLQQLLIFLSDLHNNIDNRLQTDVVYFDFRMSLDTVPITSFCANCGSWVSQATCGYGLNCT